VQHNLFGREKYFSLQKKVLKNAFFTVKHAVLAVWLYRLKSIMISMEREAVSYE